jgi:predicted transcriptional regulator
MPKRKPHSGTMRLLNFRVEDDVIERLRKVAEAEHRTVSQELRRLIDLRLTEADADERKAA